MFKNILVPTDLTERSLKALDIAVKIASEDDFKVTLLHVIQTIDEAEEKEFGEFYSKLKSRAQRKMDEMVSRYPNHEYRIMKEIVFGSRVREIVRFASDKAIDLIVLSSHKIENLESGVGWATISYKVGILSHCPVMMVK